MFALLLLMAAAAATPPPADDAPEIVVRARRRKCSVQLGARTLSDAELDAYARIWAAGKPVRVLAPQNADYRCLAKIMFRLSDRGVRVARFVETPDEP